MKKFHHSFSVYPNSIEIAVQHIVEGQSNKHTANTAANSFRADKVLIISCVYRYNCTVTEISKNALVLFDG